MFKNTASQKLTVKAFADAGHASLDAGEPVTGDAANITCKVEQDDDGTQTATNDVNPTEVEDGIYTFDLTQAETNGDKLTFYPESSTAGVQVVSLPSVVIYTRPPNFGELGIESDGDITKVNTLDGHTPQTGDSFARIPQTLNLTASGNIGIDWANVENPTTALDLSGTDIQYTDSSLNDGYQGGSINIAPGSTSQIIPVKILNTINGEPLTGLVYNSPGLQLSVARSDATMAAGHILSDMTLGTWTSAGFKEFNSSSHPGLYYLGIPDSALTSGAESVILTLSGATNMQQRDISIDLAPAAPTTAQIKTQAGEALDDRFLQYIFHTAYDPASKPGNASGLFNVLMENDGGVPRYTVNALEQAPAGGGGGSGNVTAISGSTTAADRLEAILDSSGSTDTGIAANIVSSNLSAPEITTGISGGVITQYRGDNWSFAIEGLGNITGNQKVWFAVKTGTGKTDAESLVQIEKSVGLIYINGSSGTAANGSVTVDDATAGDITITLKAVEAAKLEGVDSGVYDVQWMNASDEIKTLSSGRFVLTEDVNRATS